MWTQVQVMAALSMPARLGVEVVDLDMTRPFTMARGRNAGLNYLSRDITLTVSLCSLSMVTVRWLRGGLIRGLQFLDQHPRYAGVCGNRNERYPQATLYNQLIAMEWQGSAGEVDACGGDAIYRIEGFRLAGQFNEAMIAGEEADLCLRLRYQGLAVDALG